ncbi:hypothetical protein TTHERM_00483540 (macronuclear) [Tetrahymena thermophila SB210]|uniref:Uncharacterized protein n=1 Tax=Tetrahymena thermophila (strain SB210) TaxID=312017 RepID=I7M859_TETTS|nr:hypothetical protein TTHERM_00483540 [Tetrahymena thermophila SB210]EAR97222.1 hypothetical protein TTHERM_00483540 [Tetrahymena thermophila SB210]|eukprot:XP_001017467.1 hypothetical protein TTHERM_00483540 [Tetrahymena thermophila SB210]
MQENSKVLRTETQSQKNAFLNLFTVYFFLNEKKKIQLQQKVAFEDMWLESKSGQNQTTINQSINVSTFLSQ